MTIKVDEIIEGCKHGERKAQERLYKEFYRSMITICLRYTKNEQDAVEVLNNGFLLVFRHIKTFDPSRASLYTWMRTIMINSCIKFISSKEDKLVFQEVPAESSVESPSVVGKLDAAALLEMIRQLPPASRAVFNLYEIEGYRHQEIATLLNISEGTSKWHLNNSRKILQQALKEKEVRI